MKIPSDFMGSVIGESEKKTDQILEASRGCVLVIDEVRKCELWCRTARLMLTHDFLSTGLWVARHKGHIGSLQGSDH